MQHNSKSALFYMPSFYGLCAFFGAFALYHVPLVAWDALSLEAYFIYFTVILAFAVGTFVSFPQYAKFLESDTAGVIRDARPRSVLFIYICHAIGFFGLLWHLLELSKYFGSVPAFLLALVSESHLIRLSEVVTPGTQLTYFGWLGIWLSILFTIKTQRTGRSFFWLLATVQLVGNLVYIDRTRPLWLLFVTGILIMFLKRPSFSALVRYCFIAVAAIGSIFSLIAAWVGKVSEGADQYGDVLVDGPIKNIYLYVTGGFPYFSYELSIFQPGSYSLSQTFYPLAKILAQLGVVADPPSQILTEYEVPFPTNVGTFLEPYLQDGGIFYVFIGIAIHAFLLNKIGLYLLRQRSPAATIAWANLCFLNCISFFVPKIVSFPTWLFLIPALALAIVASISRSGSAGAQNELLDTESPRI